MSDMNTLRSCDVVMKGGITSGVVYPLAIVELANEFRFRNVGGTSAGAIAAAVTAAAEYRRVETGSTAGFDVLRQLPTFLAGTTGGQPNLLNLFPPAKPLRGLFAVAVSLIGNASIPLKAVRAIARLFLVSPLASVVAFVPFAIALLIPVRGGSLATVGSLVLELVLLVVAVIFVAAYHAIGAAGWLLPGNGFGFTTGMAPDDRKLPGVTEWLHRTIQEAAGRSTADPPLTFGDLWTAGVSADQRATILEESEAHSDARAINLQMITTALTHGRPYRLPFENRTMRFKPEELAAYFPDDVVRFLCERSDEPPSPDGTWLLPPARDLPVLVAARMSLSFPLLFSMVPLYSVDFTRKANQQGSPVAERTWFIDGGLSSNFPVSLFDTMLPQRPVFCFDLNEFHPGFPQDPNDESKNVWMVSGNGSGTAERWHRIPTRGVAAFRAYVDAMLDTIRNWRDNTQLTVPGFRDRIVHIKLNSLEGGLNLNMDGETVGRLSKRGRFAAIELRARFGAQGAQRNGLNWNTHRWARLRSAMALLQPFLARMASAFDAPDPVYPTYRHLTSRMSDANPKTGYWWRTRPEPFQQLVFGFMECADVLGNASNSFEDGAPHPRPELRITPRI